MRLIISVFLFFLTTSLVSQQGLNNALKIRLHEKHSDNKVYAILVKGNIPKLISAQQKFNFVLNYSSEDIASIQCKLSTLSLLIDVKIITHAEFIQSHMRPMGDTMQVRNRIKDVKKGAFPLAQPYDGTGILMGFIDTGIDFNHPDFKNPNGSSRIKFLWDQNPDSGSAVPAPFNYGIEWTDTQINANQCTHSDLAYYGHGTHVSGIGAGNGLANNTNAGCASNADIIMVALKFNKTGPITADALQYILNKANALGKPCVINASVGDYYGSHDGTDLEAKLIESLIKNVPGRVFVAAAGNGGHIKYHVKTQAHVTDTNFTWLSNNSGSYDYWMYGDTAQVKNLKISMGANRSNYTDLGRVGFKNYNYALSQVQTDTLKNNGNRIGIVKSSASINAYGVYELYMQVISDTSGLFWRIETTGSGLHHAWNFDFVSSGLPTVNQHPKMGAYLMPDTFYTMVSGCQCSDEVITVSDYINLNSYYDVHDTLRHTGNAVGEIFKSSSRGPTRDGRQKPDIAATGEAVVSCIPLAMQASQIANNPQTVAQGSFHILGGGTSASAPVVAGLAALYLQKNPTATNRQVKAAITNCAYYDAFTGNSLPDYQWGYGKLDGKAAMLCGEDLTVGLKNTTGTVPNVFPNPFKTQVNFQMHKKVEAVVFVYSCDGKLIFEDSFKDARYTLLTDRAIPDYSGLLFVRITTSETTYAFKLIKD